jgi:molecular chaperone DnaJ
MLHCNSVDTVDIDDPYRELGLAPDSTDAQVKAAWRRLAAQWHPDRNASPQATRRIQRINRAVEAIRAQRGAAASPAPQAAPDESAALLHTLELSLEEAAAGCIRDLRGETGAACAACQGLGRAQPTACGSCGGTGRLRPHLWFGWMAGPADCEACNGTGQVQAACQPCAGSGRETVTWRTRLRVPAGVREGQLLHARVKLASETRPLEVTVRLKPHALFTLEPDGTIRVEVPVDGFAWMANQWTEVPTPRGLQQMRLQRSALAYRIRGHGFPAEPGAACADCRVTVMPLFPDTLSAAQEKLLARLVAGNTGDASTPAGERMAEWRLRLEAWQAGEGTGPR